MKKLLSVIILSCLGWATVEAQASRSHVSTGMNTFAFELYQGVSQPEQSAIMSPFSLSFLLALLVTGSADQTHAQFINLLHLDSDQHPQELINQLNHLNATLSGSQDVMIANAFWADTQLNYQPEFLRMMVNISDKTFNRVNFSHAPVEAQKTINAWVALNTHDYIKSILDNPPDTNTRLILTNAIFFKGLWALPFNADNTKKQPFHSVNGKVSQAAMMNLSAHVNYAENDTLQMLELHYANSHLAMAIFLPKANHSLNEMMKSLDYNRFMTLTQLAERTKPEVIISMPKFKLSTNLTTLPTVLKKLGLIDAFDHTQANFSNMVVGATHGSLYISDIIQKAVIEVDEKGTVAAAASAVVMSTRSAIVAPPQKPIYFTADHPFLFVIYDTQSNLILFIGQVTSL